MCCCVRVLELLWFCERVCRCGCVFMSTCDRVFVCFLWWCVCFFYLNVCLYEGSCVYFCFYVCFCVCVFVCLCLYLYIPVYFLCVFVCLFLCRGLVLIMVLSLSLGVFSIVCQ